MALISLKTSENFFLSSPLRPIEIWRQIALRIPVKILDLDKIENPVLCDELSLKLEWACDQCAR